MKKRGRRSIAGSANGVKSFRVFLRRAAKALITHAANSVLKQNQSDADKREIPAMTKKADDLGAKEVQKKVDDAEDKGHLGEVPDQTPNENYTVDGVTSGKPTPETSTEKK